MMQRTMSAATLWLLIACGSLAAQAQEQIESQADAAGGALTQEQQAYLGWAKQIWESLDRRQGGIALPNGVAKLEVPAEFYYLGPDDAQKVLVDVWGNPPGDKPLGMLFPAAATPFDNDVWGVTIEYQEDGYVSDEDADEIDYDDLLAELRQAAAQENQQRAKAGYEPVELIGWASAPHYDKQSHKLHWAKELRFGQESNHTLNYNIRVLGRKGVLVLNFIAGMDQHQEIQSNLPQVLAMAEFNDGFRYDQFDPSIDQMAAYGIGALVAGKVLAKTGLIATALVLLKKFGALVVVGIGALAGKLFKRKKPPAEV